jgi:predicted Zn-dependent peptidase
MRQASLSNGLRICAIEMPGVRHVSIRLIVGAGSRDDPREKAGISHFVEHLLFRGTERHPHESALRAHVASMGATMNAHTTKESTTLEIDVSARHVRSALRLIAEVLLTPTFNGLEVERRIVLEEMANVYDESDGTIWTMEELGESKLWPYNMLGIPVIGEPLTVLGITLDDVKQYLARHYRAGGMVLAIAGAFELDPLMKDIEALFGGLPPGAPERSRTTPGPKAAALHLVENRWATRCGMRMMFPCAGYGPVGIAGVLTMFVLGTNGAGRLHDVLRSRTGIAYAGDADIMLYADAGKLTVHSDVKKEKLPQLVEAVSKTLRDLRDRGPSPEELHAAKESYCFMLEAMLGTPASAAQAEGLALATNEPSLDEEIELTRAATAAEVWDWCRTTLRAKSAQIVVNGPREEDDLKSAWRAFETTLGE